MRNRSAKRSTLRRRDAAVLTFRGNLTGDAVDHLGRSLADALRDAPVDGIVVDLNDVQFVSAPATAALLEMTFRARQAGTAIVVLGRAPQVIGHLQLCGVTCVEMTRRRRPERRRSLPAVLARPLEAMASA